MSAEDTLLTIPVGALEVLGRKIGPEDQVDVPVLCRNGRLQWAHHPMSNQPPGVGIPDDALVVLPPSAVHVASVLARHLGLDPSSGVNWCCENHRPGDGRFWLRTAHSRAFIGSARGSLADDAELERMAQAFEARLGHYSAMVRLILRRGMFPSRQRRFCTEELKVYAMRDHLDTLDFDIVNALGIRADESAKRALMTEWDFCELRDCDLWRPIISWTVDDVIAIHRRHGLAPNPHYLRNSSRVGCWPCIHARKGELRAVADLDPERIDLLEALEQAVGDWAEKRALRKGTSLEEQGFNRPTWFQNANPPRDPVTRKVIRDHPDYEPTWPIRTAVAWSRTKHGGKVHEPFMPPVREQGCMRWGLCEVFPPEVLTSAEASLDETSQLELPTRGDR